MYAVEEAESEVEQEEGSDCVTLKKVDWTFQGHFFHKLRSPGMNNLLTLTLLFIVQAGLYKMFEVKKRTVSNGIE